jgi:PAS domain S-box-containing protein
VDIRFEQIQNFLIQLARGNFDYQVTPSQAQDEIDAIIIGVNMLGQELKASQEKHVALFEYSGDAILIYNAASNTFVDSNEMATVLLGYNKEDIRQLNIVDLFPNAEKTRIESKVTNLKSVLQTNFDDQIETNTGKLKYVSFLSKKLPYGGGQYFQISFRDITESKQISNNLVKKNVELEIAQNQLSQLNNNLEDKVNARTKELRANEKKLKESLTKEQLRRTALINSEIKLKKSLSREKELGDLKTSFVSIASHQFRTPLAAIQSNSELLGMLSNNLEEDTSKRFKKVTNRITREIAKMTELMDDVLILGKLTSGKVEYNPQKIDLVEFCKKLTKEFDEVQNDGRSMNIVINGEPYNVYLDPKLLTHSLSNLFSNAFKYSIGKRNPELVISFKSKEFILLIKDYGIGIPKNELSKLFHPFFRAQNVTEIKGTGLGLSIAKEYTEVNKGILTASSTEGIGSKFKISFKK